jgi:hypothetical protein
VEYNRPLNMEVATRQCIGGMFEGSSADKTRARDILAGTVTLSPHPTWAIPDQMIWTADPFKQKNWRAQLHMLRWLEPVRRAALNGDVEARDCWLNFTRSWVSANASGQSEADFAWADMVEAIRGMCLVFGLPLAEGDNKWLVDSIWEHGEWMADSNHLGIANHALHQHQSLFVIGSLFRNKTWQTIATERLSDLFETSYDAEGVNEEGSLGYHKNNYIWWRTALTRLELEGAPLPESTAKLDLAALELAHATRPDGTLELIGDTEQTTLGALDSPEINWVKSGGALGSPPAETSKVYSRGYAFGRSGWGEYERDFSDELFYSLSFGVANRVHGHADGGSITLHANGHPWLVDSGKYAYKTDPMRSYCLSRRGHNVVIIEGKEYDRNSNVKLISHSLSQELDEYTLRDEGYQGIELTRQIAYSRAGDFFVIVDTVKSEVGPVTAHQRWHLDCDTRPEAARNGYQMVRDGSVGNIYWSGSLPTLSVIAGQDKPLDGWISTKWMEKKSAPVIQATRTGEAFRYITIIAATKNNSFIVEKVEAARGRIKVSTISGRNHFTLDLNANGSSISARPVGTTEAGQSLANILINIEKLMQGQNDHPSPPYANREDYKVRYWPEYFAWINASDDEYSARVSILHHLMRILIRRGSRLKNDQGLRAAIMDVAGKDIAVAVGLSASVLGIMREPLIKWAQSPQMISNTYKSPVQTVNSPQELIDLTPSPTITTMLAGGLVLPYIARRGTNKTLTVKFHGALNRMKTSLPLFQGLTASNREADNYMIFQDPSLDLDRSMNLGWYLGVPQKDLHQTCAELILAVKNQIGADKIQLTGSSGGGFAALQVASFIPDSTVLVFNPQTDVRRYFRAAADVAISACFNERISSLAASLEQRVSVIARYSTLVDIPRVMYVQNRGDAHHVQNHRAPFASMMQTTHPQQLHRVRFMDEDWGPGHVAPDLATYARFYDEMADWSE